MSAIFLGTARGDALMGDAELEPPDIQPVEAVDAGGCERRAIVAANRLREPAGAEQVPEMGFHAGTTDIGQALAAEQIAAEVIDDG